ncbi:MAG: PQQ-binding-like beta-propeller repeat protein [Chthonomonadaceae bacterium]|nr:PQQ-binding-like beta-propeller repeat protein [Chthonomonadaceae bacterium]
MNIRTVNLIWEKRVRGSYAVAPYAVTNEGMVARALPRPLEARTFDLSYVLPDESVEAKVGFSVETLLKLDVTSRADSFLGLTADDLYLFHDGKKERFLHDKRILFSDAALSGNGKALICGFSDMAGGSHAIAFGEINGHLAWTKDVDAATVTAVTISGDGLYAAYGTDTGRVISLSSKMREAWTFEVEEKQISALASSENGFKVAYGTQKGAVGVIRENGGKSWSLELDRPVTSVAINGDGTLTAGVVSLLPVEGETQERSRLVLITEGRIGWEHLFEKPIARVALSPSGGYLVVSGRDGTTTLFEVVSSANNGLSDFMSHPADSREKELAMVDVFSAQGKDSTAYMVLEAQTKYLQTNLEIARRAFKMREDLLTRYSVEIRQALDAEDTLKAILQLREALLVAPHDEALCRLRTEVIQVRVTQLIAIADEDTTSEPESFLKEAIELDPYNFPLRERLISVLTQKALAFDARAEAFLQKGETERGVTELERAQSVEPTAERATRLEHARTAQEFALGMEYYGDKDYTQAVFQFRKVLGRDPDHAEAKRHLQYAQKFQQDVSADNSLSNRFSMLE